MRSPAAHVHTRLTYDDFVHFPDDGNRHELIDGAHYVTPSPDVRHQAIVVRLVVAIATYLQRHPVGRVFVAPLDVVLSTHDIVEPDVLFVAADQADIVAEKNVQGPPALVVEVLSLSTRKRDAQAKRRLFERTGVREYWLVDPELDTVQVLRMTPDGKLLRVVELSVENDETLTIRCCQIGLWLCATSSPDSAPGGVRSEDGPKCQPQRGRRGFSSGDVDGGSTLHREWAGDLPGRRQANGGSPRQSRGSSPAGRGPGVAVTPPWQPGSRSTATRRRPR